MRLFPGATRVRQCGRALFVMVLLLTACGTALAAKGDPRATAPVVFLHYWTDDFRVGVDAMMQAITVRHPSLQILTQGFEHEAFKLGIRAILRGEGAPDIISNWAGQRTKVLAEAGMLTPVDDVWRMHRMDDVFPPALREACTYGGKRYGVPVTMHWVGFFYDTALFATLGLEPPRTWEAFLAVCEAIKRHGRRPLALGLQGKWPAQFWFDFLLLRTAGPEFRERLLNGQESFLDPRVRRVFLMWQELLEKEYFLPQPALYDWAGAVKTVHGGEAGMTLMGTWVVGMFEGKLGWKPGTDFDFFAFPMVDADVPRANLGPVDLVALTARGNRPQGRAALAAFADADAQLAMSRGSGALAPSTQVPPSAYSSMQQRILAEVRSGTSWEFAFDLTASEPLARAGLQAFEDFQTRRRDVDAVLRALHQATLQRWP